ncbi:S-layer homology domain-containing protein [Colidextribacter sp. OB.20]|uniref:S-layer homology domain-containing protein n=1 Tax=Colidextribacter sp. OB.20 TaxID=2304568 RepID=UPI00136858C8|nr:S-layer homology domain-containing protein [Colidextribacter sp. OB.20]
MNQKLAALALSGVLLCSAAVPTLAAGSAPSAFQVLEDAEMENVQSLPSSVLDYGEVKAILTGADGTVTGLHMDCEQSGEYVMRISDETFWIDSGRQAPGSPSDLAVGERLYVFHSSVSTRSMPPQSAAFAVVRNVPQDAGCAMYCKVEAVTEQEGQSRITTDNGGLFLYAGQETTLSSYTGNPVTLNDIQPGTCIMAWYEAVALSYPGQACPRHIMVLDQVPAAQTLTRSALIGLLHEAEGKPVVNYLMNYSDVDQSAPNAEAIRWASSEGIISGYGDGRVGPDDPVSREQLAVILWRWAGSPMLMDYPGLGSYSDVGDISLFAQPALAWAHQKGLIPADGRLGPKDTASPAEAEAMLTTLQGAKKVL